MNLEFKDLLEEFKKINKKRWIKSVNNNRNGVGMTFEKELNKSPDALYFPDYAGIEIKCTSRFSKYPFYLFSVAFDGPTFPEINRIVNIYGYPDKDFNDKNVLFNKLNFRRKNITKSNYKLQLNYQEDEGRIYLVVYDMNNNLIEKKSFVYIDSILNHLYIKLNSLAIVYASRKNINGADYFRYYKIVFYKLKDNFLELLKDDIINIDLISRIGKSGVEKGKYCNKNLVFNMQKDNIEKLFYKIYEFNADNPYCNEYKDSDDGFYIFPSFDKIKMLKLL